jgi:hypothetical protein
MAKKSIKTISDKLAKVNDNFTVNMYDNGYMIDVSGTDIEGEWASARILCSTVDELATLVHEATTMERS